MSEFKSKLLEKILNQEYLTDFELKKYNEYLKKINIMTYMMYEDRPHMLDDEYIEWAKLKIEDINKELSQDFNLIKFLNK